MSTLSPADHAQPGEVHVPPESNSSSATGVISAGRLRRRIGGLFNGLTEVPDLSWMEPTSSEVSPALPGVQPQRLAVEITVNPVPVTVESLARLLRDAYEGTRPAARQ